MIVRSNPTSGDELNRADQAWFDSDAQTNTEAVREIDAEAGKYGLVRTREFYLQTFDLPDGRPVRRGFCYRPGPSSFAERVAARRGNEPVGMTSAEMVRAMRDGE